MVKKVSISLSDLDAGISGSMSSALLPDKIRPVIIDFLEG